MGNFIEFLVSFFYRDFEAENHPYLMEIFKILFLSIIIISASSIKVYLLDGLYFKYTTFIEGCFYALLISLIWRILIKFVNTILK